MDINKAKIALENKINEAVLSLVDLNSESVAEYRHRQGIIHGLKTAFFIIRSLDVEEREDPDESVY